MKRKLKCILAPIILLPMIVSSSCVKQPTAQTDNTATSPAKGTPPITAISPAPTDWHSGVKTDYSGLTPYKPLEEKYTRLKDGAMPNLVPSHNYGELLPYVGETMYADDGYNTIYKYGLMTASGQLVTDPVYSNIYQGSYYDNSTYHGGTVAAYALVRLSDKIDKDKPWESEIHAVCASDGSWLTKFEYSNIFFNEKVIMLVRNLDKNDIDVMDYSGKLLYNTKSLSCYSNIPASSAYMFQSGYGEGLIALPLTVGKTVFIDVLTGAETYTDYEDSTSFSNGLAAVKQNGLYGYIDKSFSLRIPPQFMTVNYFEDGLAVVVYPDRSNAIIDKDGNVLLKNQYYISKWDSDTFGVYDANNNVVYYDNKLHKIVHGNDVVTPIYDGWFSYSSNNSVTVFKGDASYTLNDVNQANSINGNFVTVLKNGTSSWQEGLMTLDGKVMIPMAENQSIMITASEKSGKTFAISNTYDDKPSFKVYNTDGKILFSGNGNVSFYAQYDLFEVNDKLSFGYVDTSGNDVFRISLLQYVPD